MIRITKIKGDSTDTPDQLCNSCSDNRAEFELCIGSKRHAQKTYLCAECMWDLKDLADDTTFTDFTVSEKRYKYDR